MNDKKTALDLAWCYLTNTVPVFSKECDQVLELFAPTYQQTMGSMLLVLLDFVSPRRITTLSELIDFVFRVNGPSNDYFQWVETILVRLTSGVSERVDVSVWNVGVQTLKLVDTKHYTWKHLTTLEERIDHGVIMQHCLHSVSTVWNHISNIYEIRNVNGQSVQTVGFSHNNQGLFAVTGKQSQQQSSSSLRQVICSVLNDNPSLLLTLSENSLVNHSIVNIGGRFCRIERLNAYKHPLPYVNVSNIHTPFNIQDHATFLGDVVWCNVNRSTRPPQKERVAGRLITSVFELYQMAQAKFNTSV